MNKWKTCQTDSGRFFAVWIGESDIDFGGSRRNGGNSRSLYRVSRNNPEIRAVYPGFRARIENLAHFPLKFAQEWGKQPVTNQNFVLKSKK